VEPPPAPRPPEHEFTPDQNRVIADLANALVWVGTPLVVLGALYLVIAFVPLFQLSRLAWQEVVVSVVAVLLPAVLLLFLGTRMKAAAVAFQQVTSTTGSDIGHLMSALDSLRRLFGLLRAFVQVYLLLAITLLIANLVLLATAGAR
jgi:hypothetical protein